MGLVSLAGLVSACLIGAFAFYKLWIYPAFLSPLSKIPAAHRTAGYSSVWIFWIRYQQLETQTIHEAHRRLGPVVRLGPSEISVNCVKGGIQTIYSGAFEKGIPEGNWYFIFANYGFDNMFSMARNKVHSVRKRMISNIYSKSSLQNSRAMAANTTEIINKRLIPFLERSTSAPFNIAAMFSAVFMDLVTAYEFGLAASSNFLQNPEKRDHFIELYTSRQDFAYWAQEWPKFSRLLANLGLDPTPQHVYSANAWFERWCMGMCDEAARSLVKSDGISEKDASKPGDYPVVYAQMKAAMDKEAKKQNIDPEDESNQRLDIASELLDQFAAGFDTSGITLTFLVYELSLPQNMVIQDRLRSELRGLPVDEDTRLPSPRVIDAAPYLHAIVYETLRLHAAIPGPQPRTTPYIPGGSTFGPNGEYPGIPGGVRVSAQAWSLHRNPEVFPEPDSFLPGRWLSVDKDGKLVFSPTSDMNRWFWAFGSGGRMCIGSNLAIHDMKYTIYAIWTNFMTTPVDEESHSLMHKDAYTAPPVGHRLDINLKKI